MPNQLSDCCKAYIKITGKDRPEAFACVKCGRYIGTPITKTWQEEFDKRFIDDKYVSRTGMIPIYDTILRESLIQFITDLRKRDMDELIKIFPDDYFETDNREINRLIKDYYSK